MQSVTAFHNLDSAIRPDAGDAESGFPSGSYGAVQAGLGEGQGALSSHARAIVLWRSVIHVMGGLERIGRPSRTGAGAASTVVVRSGTSKRIIPESRADSTGSAMPHTASRSSPVM